MIVLQVASTRESSKQVVRMPAMSKLFIVTCLRLCKQQFPFMSLSEMSKKACCGLSGNFIGFINLLRLLLRLHM